MNYKLKIKDLPKNERPREKMLRYGAEYLSNSELLALILRTGTKEDSVLNLCDRLLSHCGGINGISSPSINDLKQVKGIGEVKATQVLALAELATRFNSFKSGEDHIVSSPKDVSNYMMRQMKGLKKEYFKLIMLNTKNIIISVKDISIGNLNSSIVHPREVFIEAIKLSSASVILCHNHPSGDPTPSKEDILITKRLKECGTLLGIEVLDHIIIGNKAYISLKEKGII
ncbi:RadC family protein [Clostridium sp. UBA4395]|uniref:RadC family protein n=1 Tax=Clostridium sp. UBA4395 TaxID=1946360 RepID=UPI003217C813